MSSKNSANEFFRQIKLIVDNYMRNRKPASVMVGTYTGNQVMTGNLPIPMSMVKGNAVSCLIPGDLVRLLRNDGGHEFFILEIIGKPYQLEQKEGEES